MLSPAFIFSTLERNNTELNIPVKFNISIAAKNIGLDTIIPIGLLINEIVSNSLKYAFNEHTVNNTITIRMVSVHEKSHYLVIGDNGVGCRVDLNKSQETFGMELIKILVEQLNGTIDRLPEPGTMFRINFQSIDKELNKTP